jgi:hypothetical protein
MRVETDLLIKKKKPKCSLQGALPPLQKGALHWKLRPPVFIGVTRVEMLVLLLPHVSGGNFFPGMAILGLLF